MAGAGFAGSLIVHAGWKGKNLSRGLKNSQRETKKFGGMIKGLLAMTAVGASAFAGYSKFKSFALMSKKGAESWTSLGIAWHRAKTQLAQLLQPLLVPLIELAVKAATKFGDFLIVLQQLGPTFSALWEKAKKFASVLWSILKTLKEIGAAAVGEFVQGVSQTTAKAQQVMTLTLGRDPRTQPPPF